jgi:disulfide bond formation protein DsbB
MSAQTLHDIFAVMAIIALVGVVLLLLARFIPAVPAVRFSDAIWKVQLPLAALVGVVSTLGSLIFSEHFGWIPCRFCWFQRIFMFSVAVVLVVGAIRRDRGVKWYAVPLASIGLLLSGYHNLIERGVVGEAKECAATTPCAVPNLISFGSRNSVNLRPEGFPSITLAVMAFCGFAAILALLLLPEPLEAGENGESSAS